MLSVDVSAADVYVPAADDTISRAILRSPHTSVHITIAIIDVPSSKVECQTHQQ
jgi:hypothetical protein